MLVSVFFRSLILATALISDPGLSIKIVPQVVMAGSAIRVTCHVPRNAANRWLEVAISDYVVEGRQLDGEDAKITHEFIFDHIPCVAEYAVCAVKDQFGTVQQVHRTFQVAGCN